MLQTYLAELNGDSTISVAPIEPTAISIPNNDEQALLLAHFWAKGSPAGQIDFFTIGKILDMDKTDKSRPWLAQFCYSVNPRRVVFDVETDDEYEIHDPHHAAFEIFCGLTDLRTLILEHEEEIEDLYTYPIYKN